MREFSAVAAADWYWLADDGRVFSSARLSVVGKDDAGLAAWSEAGAEHRPDGEPWPPTAWPRDDSGAQTAASLHAVLTPYGIFAALADLQAALSADIDKQAQAQRDLYVTPGGAQSATYLLKQTQAAQALAAQSSNTSANMTAAALAALYPYLANEIGVTADPSTKSPATDVYGVARAVQAVLQAWQPINLAIERMRLVTKAAINAAATVAAAQAAHDAVSWPPVPTS